MTRFHTFILTVALTASGAAAPRICTAQEPLDWSVPPSNPLRLASVPMRLSDMRPPGAQKWSFEGTVSYFNMAGNSWHIETIHRELGLEGQPITDDELRTLEQRHPEEEIFYLDMEGWQIDLHLSRNLGAGYALSVHIPWMEVGSPNWDTISYDFHKAFGLDQGPRGEISNGGTMFYLFGDGEAVQESSRLAGSGIADISLSVTGPIGRALGGDHRWAAVVEAPTGDRDGLWGSGGWDVGLRWLSDWRFSRILLQAAAGYSWLDGSGTMLGLERSDVWQIQGVFGYRLARTTSLRFAVWYGTSPLADATDSLIGDPGPTFDLGVRTGLGQRTWIALNLGENDAHHSSNPDFTLQIQLGTTFGGSQGGTP